ncbi:methyl-accepting chemotaxis protein [Paenibacillus sp. L3-i20]|uniref:methyl-accepting chemotaxis protein n=1 Tax=Paenibacillus sp. L3-i20 TaxID=2905833 RepID=UPI001EE00386|nr:methyl-accepting chemotaxis protein [Paenibacillus sp. L3-i20]GKU75628.1 chemotaxis protein [Paenibacillus sp. L3-i20]
MANKYKGILKLFSRKKVGGSSDGDKHSIAEGSTKGQTGIKLFLSAAKKAKHIWRESNVSNPLKSVGMKLFIVIFGSIIACVLTVGLLAYYEARTMVEKKVSEASLQTINQVASNLDVIFKTYEDLSLQLLADKEFHSLVRDITDVDDYVRFEATRNLNEKIQGYTIGNNTIEGMLLIPLREGLHVVSSGSALKTRAEALAKTDWFQKTIELDGKVNWIAPHANGISMESSTPTMALSRLLKNGVSSDASYVLIMEMEAEVISNRYSEVKLGEHSEVSIIGSNGNYILANDLSMIGMPAKVNLPTTGVEAESGSPTLKTTDGVEVLAGYKKLASMDWKLVGTIPVEELVRDAEAIRELTWLTAIIAAIIAIGIGMLVIFAIARPLVKIRNLMNEGAEGNLTIRSTMQGRKDEIGELSVSFNRMMEQITALAIQTTRSADDVLLTAANLTDASRKTSISAKDIAIATEEIASGATNLAMEAEKGNIFTVHINEQMKKVLDANQDMILSAAEVEKASVQGASYMGVLIENTGMTEDMTRAMVEKVDALKESTGSIVKILDVLNSLTKQTNILSLNAAIEAARAGAAGKGFMVVADEIRKLADQSRQSIDVVANITKKISNEIDETVRVLSDAYPMFQKQISSVKEANGIFVSVQSQMGQFVQKLDGVTNSVSDLEQSQTILSAAMTNVSSVAEEASATSEEVASLSSEQLNISESLVDLSQKLDAVSQGLKQSLAQFKIQ